MSALVTVTRERPMHMWPPVRSAFTEAEILPVIRAEACACGGWVRQCLGDSVVGAVRSHNATRIHAAWREKVDTK